MNAVRAADLLEQASGLEHLLEAPGQVSAQQAQAPGAVAEEEQARAAGRSFAGPGAGQNGRGFVEPCPAPSASRRGRRPRAARSEPSRPRPPLRPGPHALRPPPRRGRHASAARGAEDLHRTECERRAVPVGLGERVLVDREDLVEIRHREHRARRDEAGADRVRDGRLVRAQDRAVGEGLARERDDLRRRPARTCVVVGEQGEQQLLASGPARGSTRTRSSRWAASRWSPGANRPFVIRPAARKRSSSGSAPASSSSASWSTASASSPRRTNSWPPSSRAASARRTGLAASACASRRCSIAASPLTCASAAPSSRSTSARSASGGGSSSARRR